MKVISFVVLVAAMYASSAFGCSINMLKRAAEQHLDRLPSSAQHDFINPPGSGRGGTWQMFEGANGRPHSLVVTLLGELGQTRIRISFLNRRDFVISETVIDYDEHIFEKDRTGKFKVQPTQHYFFCGGNPQISADAPDSSKIVDAANQLKKWIFEDADMLKPELQRVPE